MSVPGHDTSFYSNLFQPGTGQGGDPPKDGSQQRPGRQHEKERAAPPPTRRQTSSRSKTLVFKAPENIELDRSGKLSFLRLPASPS